MAIFDVFHCEVYVSEYIKIICTIRILINCFCGGEAPNNLSIYYK
jgi:hypothetical protein